MRKLFSIRVKPDQEWWTIEGSVNAGAVLSVAVVVWLSLWIVSNGVEYVMAAVK
jgi:hypothetical protein